MLRRNDVRVEFHQGVLVEKLLDGQLREHTALVIAAVRSAQPREVQENKALLFLGPLQSFRKIAKPNRMLRPAVSCLGSVVCRKVGLVAEKKSIDPAEYGPARTLRFAAILF